MNYTVIEYRKGVKIGTFEVTAASQKDAAKHFFDYDSVPGHVAVIGKTVKRFYSKQGKAHSLKDGTAFKTAFPVKGKPFPAILILFKNVPEIHTFQTKEQRDNVYEEMTKCSTSTPAESVIKGKVQNDIIVFSDEMSAIKNGSMLKKTLNGSATIATWQEKQTPLSIAKSSGKSSVKSMGEPTWSGGSTSYPSKTSPYLTAKVLPIIKNVDTGRWPGINSSMLRLVGKTIQVKKDVYWTSKDVYDQIGGGEWKWKAEWIEITEPTAEAKPTPKPGSIFVTVSPVILRESYNIHPKINDTMKTMVGKDIEVKEEFSAIFGVMTYRQIGMGGWLWRKEWLIFKDEKSKMEEKSKKGEELPRTIYGKFVGPQPGQPYQGITFLPSMKQSLGKRSTFKYLHGTTYKGLGWYLPKAWIQPIVTTEGA